MVTGVGRRPAAPMRLTSVLGVADQFTAEQSGELTETGVHCRLAR